MPQDGILTRDREIRGEEHVPLAAKCNELYFAYRSGESFILET